MINYAYASIEGLLTWYNSNTSLTSIQAIENELKHRDTTIEECKIKYPELFI
jgi:hypothetical protein